MSVNKSNWREDPHHKWSFQNVDQVLRTQTIEKSTTPSPLKTQLRDFKDFKVQLGNKPSFDLPNYLSFSDTDGIVLLHKGAIVYEAYGNDNSPASKHILMSTTKSINGVLAGILSSQGKIDLNAPIKKYVPEASEAFDGVTVQQCLDMCSGIKFDDNSHDYRYAMGWVEGNGNEIAENLHDFLSRFTPATPYKPGTRFEYTSVNTDLVGWALERVSGKTYAELVSELLWQPMGAESDALMAVDSAGNARAAGGLCVTARDLARVGQLVAEGGRGVISLGWIKDLVEGGNVEAFEEGDWAPLLEGELDQAVYRSSWTNDRAGISMGMGIHGQHLIVDRVNGVVMAKTSSQAQAVDFFNITLATRAFKEFRRIILSGSA